MIPALLLLSTRQEPASAATVLTPEIRKPLHISAVSPGGQKILVMAGVYPPSGVWMISDKEVSELKALEDSKFGFVAIGNDGTILANTYPPAFGNAVLLREGEMTVLSDVTLRATGMSPKGEIFGNRYGGDNPLPYGDLVYGGQGDWTRVYGGTEFIRDQLLGRVPQGLLARVTYPLSKYMRDIGGDGRGNLTGFELALWIDHDDVPHVFEIPPESISTHIDAWSEDGSIIAGHSRRRNEAEYCVIWRNDGSIVAKPTTKKTEFLAQSVSGDGSLVVGHVGTSVSIAAVWRKKEGLQALSDYLKEKKTKIPEDWTLVDAAYVSKNGDEFVGTAKIGKGNPFVYRIRIPEEEGGSATKDGG